MKGSTAPKRIERRLSDRKALNPSVKAGLRAGEIANLTWDMVLDPRAEVGTVIELHDDAAKKGIAFEPLA
jgi:hypothetical protein